MQSFSSLDNTSEFMYTLPARFHRPIKEIKFCRHNKQVVESILDTAKENLCPFQVRYVVLNSKPELLKDLRKVRLSHYKESQELTIICQGERSDIEKVQTDILKKLSYLSNPLQESFIPIDNEKAEFLLRHFDNFVSSKPDQIMAFIESHRIKIIYKSDDDKKALTEEFENVNAEITRHTIDNIEKIDILKLQLDKEAIQNGPAKIEIGVDFIKIEGFPIDVASAKLQLYKAMKVNIVLLKKLHDNIATLLSKDAVVMHCNQLIKKRIPNTKLLSWKIDGDTLLVVGRNESIARTCLETIENCYVTFTDDFSGLTLHEESHMIRFKDSLQRDFQGSIVLNDTDVSNIAVTTIYDREEQARMRFNDFKSKFTLETKDIKVSADKAFYLQASQEDLKAELFSGQSLCIQKGAENEVVKITAYGPEVMSIEEKTVVTKSYGLNDKEFKQKLLTGMQDFASDSHNCKLKIQDKQAEILVKDERIEEQKVDVIVNSVHRGFDMSCTHEHNVASSISKAAGPGTMKSMKQKYPDGIKFGEVIYDRETGKLNCNELCHIHLEKYTQERGDNHTENLRKIVGTCLRTAEEHGQTSIAFPAVGAGTLGYPLAIVAEVLLDCIVKQVFNTFETGLRTFIIAIPWQDVNVKKAFEDEITKRKKSLEQREEERPCLIEHPQWLCEWKVDIVGETEEEIEEFVKMISATLV